MNWIDTLLQDGSLEREAQAFVLANRSILQKLGKDSFEDFVYLIYKDKQDEAMETLVGKFTSAKDLAAIMDGIADEQEAENEAKAHLKKVGMEFIKTIGKSALKILLTKLILA